MARKAPKRIKHVPQRTCIGCRSVLSKRELIRIVRTPQGVLIDPTGKVDGRGAYLHNLKSCWEQAIKGSLNAALKVELTDADRARFMEFMATLPPGDGSSAGQSIPDSSKGQAK